MAGTTFSKPLDTEIAEIKAELKKRGTTVNGVPVDENGNFLVDDVTFAHQIVTDDFQKSSDTYSYRTTGGTATVADGTAKLVSIQGRSVHTGIVPESLAVTVTMVDRPMGHETETITAVVDRDVFVAEVTESGTTTFEYDATEEEWSLDPETYGLTITGDPYDGDQIDITYVKAELGTITNANPTSFVSTGWNLYNNTTGRARVLKYSDEYGFKIGGAYTTVEFATTISGERETVTVTDSAFEIDEDGYIFITGGDATTYIYMTWSDWTSSYTGDLQTYTESTIDLSSIMSSVFPNGLMSVGSVCDEINFNMRQAISRITVTENYTEEQLEAAKASGRGYDYDDDNLYVVSESEHVYAISGTGDFTASDHGCEFLTYSGDEIPVFVQTLYGNNLVQKLKNDVLTISQQTLTDAQKTQVLTNIGAASDSSVSTLTGRVKSNFVSTATDLDTLVTDNTQYVKRWRGDNCTLLTHAPASANVNIPWELEAGIVGSNINYQYQEFRLYTTSNNVGSRRYRRQKYYYGPNDFRWNDWVNIDEQVLNFRFLSNTNNSSTFTFDVGSAARYRLGLVMYQSGPDGGTLGYLGLLFFGVDNTPVITNIWKGSNSIIVTPSYSNGILTITSNSTLYGGIRILYLD